MTDFDDASYSARNTDPSTSHRAARVNRRSRDGQKGQLLLAHYNNAVRDPSYDGFSADEAARAANMPVPANGGTSKSCYWKRHSELWHDHEFLRPRHNQFGGLLERDDQMVLIITNAGVAHAERLLRIPD